MNTHHAILFEGKGFSARENAVSHVKSVLGVSIEGNPDVLFIETERFTIDHARDLKKRAYQTPLGTEQVFILLCDTILREAQNALLKLFEEPPKNTYFVVSVSTKRSLLPTILSRLSYIRNTNSAPIEMSVAQTFLQSSIKQRRALLQPIIKEKDRVQASDIVDAIEAELYNGGVKKNSAALHEIVFVRNYLNDTASSLKMLLEHLILTV